MRIDDCAIAHTVRHRRETAKGRMEGIIGSDDCRKADEEGNEAEDWQTGRLAENEKVKARIHARKTKIDEKQRE